MNKFTLLAAISAASISLTGCMTMDDEMAMDDTMPMANASSTTTVKVGGADMFASRNIVENAVNSPIHTTLVKAVKAADLVGTLSGPGPFTVFAPTDTAFAALPSATVNAVMMPENKALLQKVLTYHVLQGRVTAADLMKKIKAGGGQAMLTTVAGEKITATMEGKSVKLAGMSGSAYVTQADVMQSNGIIHVVNGVLLPQ